MFNFFNIKIYKSTIDLVDSLPKLHFPHGAFDLREGGMLSLLQSREISPLYMRPRGRESALAADGETRGAAAF